MAALPGPNHPTLSAGTSLSYPLSYRQVAEMVNERGLEVHHVKVYRWVQEYGQK